PGFMLMSLIARPESLGSGWPSCLYAKPSARVPLSTAARSSVSVVARMSTTGGVMATASAAPRLEAFRTALSAQSALRLCVGVSRGLERLFEVGRIHLVDDAGETEAAHAVGIRRLGMTDRQKRAQDEGDE